MLPTIAQSNKMPRGVPKRSPDSERQLQRLKVDEPAATTSFVDWDNSGECSFTKTLLVCMLSLLFLQGSTSRKYLRVSRIDPLNHAYESF